jgi:nucleotide-binding universal stress UspA family protein
MTGDKPVTRIVVPVDGSPLAESAISPASALARRLGVPLTLFGLTITQHDRDNTVGRLEELVTALPPDLHVDVVVDAAGVVMRLDGYVARSILDEANADGALVCIASHGRSGLGAALLGSVTEQVLRGSGGPVVVVGPRCHELDLDNGLIVACLDGSRFAEEAAPAAATWASGLGLPLWLVQVAELSRGAATSPGDFSETAYLESVADQYRRVDLEVLHGHHPARELAELTTRWSVALLVLATHGRSGWSRLALGSVAMNVVHHAACPVVLVRPNGVALNSGKASR